MRKVMLLFLCIFIGSCSGIQKTDKPDPFFDTNKMASIMTDVYLVEGSMTSNRKSFIDLGVIPDQYIYEKHKIDSLSFKANFNYYADRVEVFMEILDIVDENLLVIKDSVNARQERLNNDESQLKSIIGGKKSIDTVKSVIKTYLEDDK